MSKVWTLVTNSRSVGPEIYLFKEKPKAHKFAFGWIMDATGGPSAWRPDEWPQMRKAIEEVDVDSMITYYNNASQDRDRDFIYLEHLPLK